MSYSLHIPANRRGRYPALLVMLHGCSQTPEDFARGTRMNEFADRHGFVVVYPAQSAAANPMSCWNWFNSEDQVRDRGEPSLIAGIAREVAAAHDIDARRVFVAGLSAGGAMAVILGVAYPELFAAVGVHSGLPYGAAHDAVSALRAMRGTLGGRAGDPRGPSPAIPTIAFHGDCDTTVDVSNGSAITEAAVLLAERAVGGLRKTVRGGTSPGGRTYTNTVYRGPDARTLVEYWVVHGAGHAWSGGSAAGSFTDPAGPDASAEMVRFFLAQSHR